MQADYSYIQSGWLRYYCTNPHHSYSRWLYFSKRAGKWVYGTPKWPKSSRWTSSGVEYQSGGKTFKIDEAHLKNIRSRVTTHEGEVLSGKRGRKYMDEHSAQMLGKDLSGTYNKLSISDR